MGDTDGYPGYFNATGSESSSKFSSPLLSLMQSPTSSSCDMCLSGSIQFSRARIAGLHNLQCLPWAVLLVDGRFDHCYHTIRNRIYAHVF